jgi:hypothetical protein
MVQHVIGGERLKLRYLGKTKLRGLPKVALAFNLAAAAYDFLGVTKLAGAAA